MGVTERIPTDKIKIIEVIDKDTNITLDYVITFPPSFNWKPVSFSKAGLGNAKGGAECKTKPRRPISEVSIDFFGELDYFYKYK